jgi:hypothetical protein
MHKHTAWAACLFVRGRDRQPCGEPSIIARRAASIDSDAQVSPGDRFTYDGQELGNHIPVQMVAQYQQLLAKLNSMDTWKRAEAHQDAEMVQQFRNAGYVFDSNNRIVSAVAG